MTRNAATLTTVALAALLTAVGHGADFTSAEVRTPPPGVEARHLTPLHQEIGEIREATSERLEGLYARIAGTPPGPEYLELQREAEAIKKDAQVRVFEVQLRHARDEGRTEEASRLAETLRLLSEPPVAPAPTPAATGSRPPHPERSSVAVPN